jgi:hypothetical protein
MFMILPGATPAQSVDFRRASLRRSLRPGASTLVRLLCGFV